MTNLINTTIKRRAKRFYRHADPPPIQLRQRDVAVLEALAAHRLLSADQLRRLVFECSASYVRRRLRALYDHGLIDRVAVAAQPTKNIPPFVYVLSRHGAACLQELGLPVSLASVKSGASLGFVRHRLLVNDFFITLTEATRDTDTTVADWRYEHQLKLPGPDGRGVAERVALAHPPHDAPFLPDAYFHLTGPAVNFAFFVEIDLATHSQAKWVERAHLYTAYADPTRGLFERRFGRKHFRLLIVTTPDWRGRSRCRNVLTTIQETIGASDMFLATTLTELSAERILHGRIWHQPAGGTAQPLVAKAPSQPSVS